MKRLLAVAALLLVFAPGAHAKEPGQLQLCGLRSCVGLAPLGEFPIRLAVVDSRAVTELSVAPAPYYYVGGAVWVPSASALRIPVDGTLAWVATLPAEDALLSAKVAGLQPYAPPVRLRIYVDFDLVERASGWQRLFTLGTPTAAAPAATTWLSVWLTSGRTPWDDSVWLWVSKSGNLLQRDGRVYEIPSAVAKRIRARLPLSP